MSRRSNHTGPIAIDLGTYTLRMMQLSGGRQRRALAAAWHDWPTPPQEGPPDQDVILETLRGLRRSRKARFRGKSAVVVLHDRFIQVKSFRLPQMPADELASAVQYEARDRLTGLDDDAEIRFLPAGMVPGGREPQQEVIALAVPGEIVRQHLRLVEKLGLEPTGVDPSLCAVFRPFAAYLQAEQQANEVNVFIDVGFSRARILITRGSDLAFCKTFDMGGVRVDAQVAEDLSVDTAGARDLRHRVTALRFREENAEGAGEIEHQEPPSPTEREAVENAARTVWAQLGKEIGLCLRYYAVTFRGSRPETITCVGGEAQDSFCRSCLTEAVGVPCRLGHPLRALEGTTALGKHEAEASFAEWTTVAGAALKPAGTKAKAKAVAS